MKTLSFWTKLSTLTILGITISFSPSILSFSPAIATPLYLAQAKRSPQVEALASQIQSLMKEQDQLITNAQQKIFLILTPEQQREFQLASQEKREPRIQYNDTQAYVVKLIMDETEPKVMALEKQLDGLMKQLKRQVEQDQQ